jgi:hypothetical protein
MNQKNNDYQIKNLVKYIDRSIPRKCCISEIVGPNK